MFIKGIPDLNRHAELHFHTIFIDFIMTRQFYYRISLELAREKICEGKRSYY